MVTDHGEAFGDHGRTAHGWGLHQELNRVMILVHGPSLGIPARRVPLNASLVDLLPTILELLGEEAPEGLAGLSLAALVRDEEGSQALRARLEERTLLAHRIAFEEEETFWAAIRGRYKLIERESGASELFDLERDPKELENILDSRPEVARPLRELLRRARAERRESAGPEAEILLDEMLEEDAPAPEPAAEAEEAPPAEEPRPEPADREAIIEAVLGKMSEDVVREIAWEVVPDLAERLIRERIRQLEREDLPTGSK